METKVKMHDFRDGEVMQLKFFIKKLQGSARREAWSKFQDTMSFASEAAVQELWAHIDIAVELASKPAEVAKKPRVERKPRRLRKARTPKVTAKRERAYPCPTCDTGECLPKPKGKGRWPICPACHKAGKDTKKGEVMRLAAPATVTPNEVLPKEGLLKGLSNAYPGEVSSIQFPVLDFRRIDGESRFEEARERFRREGHKPRRTGKTARKNGKISLRRALELA